MTARRRISLYRGAAFLLAALLAPPTQGLAAEAGWKPTRPVAFIVGATPGGGLDLTARALQQIWEKQRTSPTPVIILNKPGASNAIAWTYMNDRGGDGHAIAIGSTNLITNPIIGTHALGHRDVTPLAILLDDFLSFVVRADSPLKTLQDAIPRLRRDPASVSVAITPGLGSPNHTSVGVACKAAGVDVKNMRFIVYKSAPEALTALLSGEVDIASVTAATVPPLLGANRIRVIAVTSAQRLGGVMSGVPTLREQGIDAVFTNWRAVIGPKGMKREAAAFWENALAEAVKTPEWRRDLERNFWTDNFRTGPVARQFMDGEAVRFAAIWKEIGTKP
jgi:putative tricarboxylic transport membrane protein